METKAVFISFITVLILAGCGGSSGDGCNPSGGSDANMSVVNGVVVDGYIHDATVCLDENNDGRCGSNEPRTSSDEMGRFSLHYPQNDETTRYTLISSGGIDTATGKQYEWPLVSTLFTTSDLNTTQLLTPLKTMAAQYYMDSCEGSDQECYSHTQQTIADKLSVSQEDLFADPMQNKHAFYAVCLVETSKKLIETLFDQNPQLDKTAISHAVATELGLAANVEFDLGRTIGVLQMRHDISLQHEKKEYALQLMDALEQTLDQIINSSEFDPSQLALVQHTLDEKIQSHITTLQNTADPTKLSEPELTIDMRKLTETVFDKEGAVYDQNACINNADFNELTNSSLMPDRSRDASNGIQLRSEYGISATAAQSQVAIFYPKLEPALEQKREIVFESEYYFAYDLAWLHNQDQTVYIKTPQTQQGVYMCYRYTLNTDKVLDINKTKVFRYN